MKRENLSVREPAVAGAFYPAQPHHLSRMIRDFLEQAPAGPCPTAKALIVPHAGYLYSGPVAASGFRLLDGRNEIERVVLVGPSHYVRFQGLALPQAAQFETPLGGLAVDRAAFGALEHVPQVRMFDRAHEPEHSLEVELPFLQSCLGTPRIVPILIGQVSDEEVAETIGLLWGGPETLLIISSDLTHFLDHSTARERDRETAASIERLEPEGVGPEAACGGSAIRGLLVAARRHGLRVTTLDLRNSGDTAGPRDRVVGYGAFAFS